MVEQLYHDAHKRFPYLTKEMIHHLVGLGEIVMLEAGQVFIGAGERSHKAALVMKGLVRNYVINEAGEEITVVFAGEFQIIAPYANVFLDRPASETCEAIEDCILFVIDFKEFRKRAEEEPLLMRLYADLITEALVNAIERIEDFTKEGPEKRYSDLLRKHGELLERVPLKYIASYLGITPVSLSRIRKRIAGVRN